MSKIALVSALTFWLFIPLPAQTPNQVIDRVASYWLHLHDDFQDTADVWGNYTLDLTLEALLLSDFYLKRDRYRGMVLDVFGKRKIKPDDTITYRSQPFCSINFYLGQLTNNQQWLTGYIHETYRMRENVRRSSEGAIMINHQGNHRILVDYLQEYASRLARTGYLTGDSSLSDEAAEQFLIYETILVDPESGLWRQGRGWCPDTSHVSRSAWSRGHGWLLRGLVTSMEYLPEAEREDLLPLLQRVASALIDVQGPSGMFHILPDLPHERSAPDVSGTGMIAFYLARAVKEGWLESRVYRQSVLDATRAIKGFVTPYGQVRSSCKGPGPLCERDEYLDYQPELDEKHGFQGVVYGMLAEALLSGN